MVSIETIGSIFIKAMKLVGNRMLLNPINRYYYINNIIEKKCFKNNYY